MSVAAIGGTKGFPALVDEQGDLACYYMGTDASLPQISAPRREANKEEVEAELHSLQHMISERESGRAGPAVDLSGDDLVISCSNIEPLDRPRRGSEATTIIFTHGLTVRRVSEGRDRSNPF